MKRRLQLGIRGKIAAVILLCMIPVVILGVLLFQYRNQGRLDVVQRSHREAARAVASDIETFLASAVEAERTAGAAVTGQPYPVIGIIQLFASIRASNPFFLSLASTPRAESSRTALRRQARLISPTTWCSR